MQDSNNDQVGQATTRLDQIEPGFTFRPASIDSLRSMRILIVDDLPTNIILMQAILEHGGFANQITADTGDKAIDLLQKHTRNGHCDIDLVLLDIILPGKNGFSICRQMRDRPEWQTIPVIMVTSESKWREETAQASYESGATEILFKPVRSNELLPRVIAALHLKHERDQRIRHEKLLQEKIRENTLLETRLKYLVSHDDLTGLFNRRRLGQVIDLAIIYARYYRHCSALLIIDIDDFMRINEIAGYSMGDQLLSDIAGVLRPHGHNGNLVARIGADEFAVFMDNATPAMAQELGATILEAISAIGLADNKLARLTASIGIAFIADTDTPRSSEVIAQAEQACKQARQAGGNRASLFNHDDVNMPAARQHQFWQPRLRQALDHDGFELALQPILDAASDRPVACELLLRLRDDERLYTPSSFLTVAENSGLIREIDDWVVSKAVAILASRGDTLHGLDLHVNVSPFALLNSYLVERLFHLLDESRIPPGRLCIHVDEAVTRQKDSAIAQRLRDIDELGCQLAFDNFDTTFDGCKHLEDLPVTTLKINNRYVQNLANDSLNQVLVRSMVEIAHTLGKRILASHIDDEATLAILKKLEVDYLQGHLVGKPGPLG